MSGNDYHLKHSVGVVLKELHAFAQATGAPAGENVFRWAEVKADEVASQQAAVSSDTQPGTSAFASEPNMTPPSADSGVREKVADLIVGKSVIDFDPVSCIGMVSNAEIVADAILQALAQPAQDGGAS